LGISSADPISLLQTDDYFEVDFTDLTLNIAGGMDAAANLSGVRALFSGAANGDGQVNSLDKNLFWRPANGQSYEYFFSSGDFNLDGVVNSLDKNFYWRANNGNASLSD